MFGFGRFEELIVILAIILVLFGGKKLPELSKGLSNSIRELRKAFKDDVSEDEPKTTDAKLTKTAKAKSRKKTS